MFSWTQDFVLEIVKKKDLKLKKKEHLHNNET